jgi:hypothetical protein
MIFWSRVWQFVSHHWCATSWFSLPCFLTSNCFEFFHDWTCVCLVYMWFFLELFVAFPICLGFSPLFGHMLTFCDTCSHIVCEILILNWMNLKFDMWLVDILSFVMVLIRFISHMLSLIYDLLKLVHVWLTSLSMLELALPFWFSLTYFPWFKWAEIWYAYHVMNDVWSWIIWWFIELFMIGFELSLAVDFYELLYAMPWPNLFMKWWWCMIW